MKWQNEKIVTSYIFPSTRLKQWVQVLRCIDNDGNGSWAIFISSLRLIIHEALEIKVESRLT
jgi:hypothetical protein